MIGAISRKIIPHRVVEGSSIKLYSILRLSGQSQVCSSLRKDFELRKGTKRKTSNFKFLCARKIFAFVV